MCSIAVILLITIFQIGESLAVDPLIQLPNGLIKGREAITITNKTYFAFEKIPYATSPLGNLRFKAPIPPKNWDGILNTTHLDAICYQQGTNDEQETEDCLFLNVFTPQLPTDGTNQLLPVMFSIHGGGFIVGSSANVYSDPIIENDVILVTINYRLGLFGFISTQDEVIPGNNGLKDQQLAMKWVHDNIHLFGGDPDQVTIFGQSAGSASCAYHLLNQNSIGLFRAAILLSGSFLSPWAYQRRAREIAFATAAFINDSFSNSNDSKALLDFLLTVDAKRLDAAADQYHDSENGPQDTEILQGFYWAPVVEVENSDAFLTKKMYGLLQAGNVVKVPIIIGMTSEESLYFNQDPNLLKSNLQAYDEHLSWLVPNDMQIVDQENRTKIGNEIRNIYTDGHPLADYLGDGVRYCSDTSFTRSIIKHAELFSKVAKTYFYQFSYHGKLGKIDIHYDGAESVSHGEDYSYIYCGSTECDFSSYSEQDQLTQKRIIKFFTNFAKYQNPTPEPIDLLQNITWPVLSTENGDFLYLNINETLEIRNHPKEETYRKWIEIYDSLDNQNFDTY